MGSMDKKSFVTIAVLSCSAILQKGELKARLMTLYMTALKPSEDFRTLEQLEYSLQVFTQE